MSHSSSKNNGENSSTPPPSSPPPPSSLSPSPSPLLVDPQGNINQINNEEEITSSPLPPPPSPLLDHPQSSEGNNNQIINNEEEKQNTPTPTPTPTPSPLPTPIPSPLLGQNQVDGDDRNSSSSVVAAPPPNPAEPVENEGQGQGELEIYGCKYCNKKFSNKQALGGHQNAHKAERQQEKKALEMREAAFGYYGLSGPGGPSSHPQVSNAAAAAAFTVNVNSFNRSHEALLNRPMPMPMPMPAVYRPMPYQTQRPPMHMANFVARPMAPAPAPAAVPNYQTPRPMLPGLNPVYVWNGPSPSVPRFVAPSNWPILYQTANPHQFMNAPRFMPPGINQVGGPSNNQVMINGGEQAQENEDSDIDLTLRL